MSVCVWRAGASKRGAAHQQHSGQPRGVFVWLLEEAGGAVVLRVTGCLVVFCSEWKNGSCCFVAPFFIHCAVCAVCMHTQHRSPLM